jgi:tRNA (mo5U34)-methyltransferase
MIYEKIKRRLRIKRKPGFKKINNNNNDALFFDISKSQENQLSDLIKSKRYWYHYLAFNHNAIMPGSVRVIERCEQFGIPHDLSGKRFLDLGTQSGGFALEFERRGAEVTTIDTCDFDLYGFETIRSILDSKIEAHKMSIYDIDKHFDSDYFDYVLFSGLFYHLRHPLLAIDKIRTIVKDTVFVESYVIDKAYVKNGNRHTLPRSLLNLDIMQFYRFDELSKDVTNWFAPNTRCLNNILNSSGFSSSFVGFSGSNTRGLFVAIKQEGSPEYMKILEESNYTAKYGNKHYIY